MEMYRIIRAFDLQKCKSGLSFLFIPFFRSNPFQHNSSFPGKYVNSKGTILTLSYTFSDN
jgi:hypothetical protein